MYGNKPDLIPRLVALLEHQFEFSPDGATLQEILSEVSNANGGTLEYYGYQRSSPLRPYAPTTTLGTLAGMKPQKVAMVPRANPPAYGAPGSSGQHPQGPPKPASKPFEGLSYSQSPFHAFHSRLYTKVVDGRSGHISITDFVMIEKHVSLILEKREGQQGQRKYGVKVYMGNPQMMSPFGDRKMIEPSFSDSCFVTVNGKAVDASVCISVPLLVFKNENSRKATKKKIIPLKKKIWACVPPDITDYLILKAGAQNRLELRFGYMYPKAVVTLELVELVSVDDRVNLVCTNSKLTKESILDERQKKVAKAAVADDDDIEATSEVICFRDPILQTRISKPGRSKKCKHTQCFDLPTFFMMNSATPTYTCAVCNSKIKWEDVVLDGFFDDILTSVGEDVDSIEIQPDGTWALPVKTEDVSRQSSSTSRPDKRKRYPEVVCLDEDDEENAEEDDEDRPLAKRRMFFLLIHLLYKLKMLNMDRHAIDTSVSRTGPKRDRFNYQ